MMPEPSVTGKNVWLDDRSIFNRQMSKDPTSSHEGFQDFQGIEYEQMFL
jgi:hypothetical protein